MGKLSSHITTSMGARVVPGMGARGTTVGSGPARSSTGSSSDCEDSHSCILDMLQMKEYLDDQIDHQIQAMPLDYLEFGTSCHPHLRPSALGREAHVRQRSPPRRIQLCHLDVVR